MTDPTIRGRFLWTELLTRHPETALRFYPAVLGWGTERYPMPDGEAYTMWTAGGRPIGGLQPLPADAKAPASWLVYIGVPDVDAAVMRAEEEGAVVVTSPADIPETGRFAVLEDPFGANFAVYRPLRDPAPEPPAPAVGEFAWLELATPNLRHALEFYEELFGWTRGELHAGDGIGDYQVLEREGRPIGGLYAATDDMPSGWLGYVRVVELTPAVEAVERGGGRLLVAPRDVPGGSRIAVAADPDGAVIALIRMPAG